MFNREQKEALEKLVIDNQDLELLESFLSEFNIFEAVGMTRQEIRHSKFLSFLLNPSENHRLGDLFLKKFLIDVLLNSDYSSLSPIDIDLANLEDTKVKREWKKIDLLIYSPSNQFVCAIENKIDSAEHSNQLQRYHQIISQEFPKCTKMFLFLTKEGELASGEEWISISYESVINVIESIVRKYESTIGQEVYVLINHYIKLIRRHIMSNSDIAQLCRKIYRQHQQALDLIYEHRPDRQTEISDFCKKLVSSDQNHNLISEDSKKTRIRFAIPEWDKLDFPKPLKFWTKSNRSVLFELVNEPEELSLVLIIAHAPLDFKQSIFSILKQTDISGVANIQLTQKSEKAWTPLYKKLILNPTDYADDDIESLFNKIESFWQETLDNEIEMIRSAIFNALSE